MRLIVFLTINLLLMSCTSAPAIQAERWADNIYGNIDLSDVEMKNGEVLDFLYLALSNTPELYTHNMRSFDSHGQIKIINKVFVRKSGQNGYAELVFGPDGEQVTDCINKGSANYYYGAKNPLLHFDADTLPWLLLGNCRQDPTTVKERLSYYIYDFGIGLKEAHTKYRAGQRPNLDVSNLPQVRTIKLFLKAIELGNGNIEHFINLEKVNDQDYVKFLNVMKTGLASVLGIRA